MVKGTHNVAKNKQYLRVQATLHRPVCQRKNLIIQFYGMGANGLNARLHFNCLSQQRNAVAQAKRRPFIDTTIRIREWYAHTHWTLGRFRRPYATADSHDATCCLVTNIANEFKKADSGKNIYKNGRFFFFCICHRNRNGWIILFGNSCTITATMNGIQFNLLLQLDAHSWRWRWRYTQNGSEYGACGRNLSPLLTTAANVFNLVFFFKLINHNWNRFNSKLEKTQWYLSIDERPSIEGKSPEWNACAQIWKRRYELYYHSREIMHIRGEIERPRERRLSLMTMRTHTAFLVGPPCLCRAWCSLIQSPHRISRCMKIAAWIFIFTLITTL